MDWFHCCRCFRQEGARFTITNCGHILCEGCGGTGPCPVCGTACRYLPISDQASVRHLVPLIPFPPFSLPVSQPFDASMPNRCAHRRRFSSRTQWPSPSSTWTTSHGCGGSRRHRHDSWWTCTGTELGGCRQSWTRPERSWERGGGSWSHFAGRMRSCAACSSPQAGAGAAAAAPPVPPPHTQSPPSPAGSSAVKWSAARPHWSPPSPTAPQDGRLAEPTEIQGPPAWCPPGLGQARDRALLSACRGAGAPTGISTHGPKGQTGTRGS